MNVLREYHEPAVETRHHKSLRRLLMACILLGVGLSSYLAALGVDSKPRSSKRLEAQEIVLTDDKGNIRIRMGMSGGQPEIALYSEAGKPQVEIGIYQRSSGGDHGAGVRLHSQSGKNVGSLGVDRFGLPGLRLEDEERLMCLHLTHNRLAIEKNNREIIWQAP